MRSLALLIVEISALALLSSRDSNIPFLCVPFFMPTIDPTVRTIVSAASAERRSAVLVALCWFSAIASFSKTGLSSLPLVAYKFFFVRDKPRSFGCEIDHGLPGV